MRNPFRRRSEQQRESDLGADIVRAWQLALAERSDGDALATAAGELAAREYAAAFAEVDVQPLQPALNPERLSDIGRQLISRGECVYLIELRGGVVRLREASTWSVAGEGDDPDGWRYQLTLAEPLGDDIRRALGAGVIHLRYSSDPRSPWRGIGPLQRMPATARAVGGSESRLADELSTPVGYVVPVPQESDGSDDDAVQQLSNDLASLKGRTSLVESTAAAWGDGRGAAPTGEWTPRRIGASPPSSLAELRRDNFRALVAACGVPPDLVHARTTTGAALTHIRRDFIDHSVQPLLRRLEPELRRKLGIAELRLNLPAHSGDVLMRARAYKDLIAAGLPEPEARAAAGF